LKSTGLTLAALTVKDLPSIRKRRLDPVGLEHFRGAETVDAEFADCGHRLSSQLPGLGLRSGTSLLCFRFLRMF
jgi:hypothetical protein